EGASDGRGGARRILLPGPVLQRRELESALRDDRARDLGADGRRLTHFVAGLGTTGTFTRINPYLKSRRPELPCISMQPDGPIHGLDGMKHMPSAMVPAIYDPTLADAELNVSTDAAFAMCRRLAREEGVLVGPSSAANIVAALKVAREMADGPATIVTVLCDGGDRYLSEPFWGEP